MLRSLHLLSHNRHAKSATRDVSGHDDEYMGEKDVVSKEGEGDDDESRVKRARCIPSTDPHVCPTATGLVDGPGDQLAGVVLFFVASRRALMAVLFVQELLSIGVFPRTGVGLMHAMLQHPDAHDWKEVQLVVRRDNSAAIAFYERLGFELLMEPARRAFEPLRDLEVCMTVRRATLAMRTKALLGVSPLEYATHRNKAAFVLQDMWRFKEVVATLQASNAGRKGSTHGARVLPGDPRVRYVVATTPLHVTAAPDAI